MSAWTCIVHAATNFTSTRISRTPSSVRNRRKVGRLRHRERQAMTNQPVSKLCERCGGDHSLFAYCGSRETAAYLMAKFKPSTGLAETPVSKPGLREALHVTVLERGLPGDAVHQFMAHVRINTPHGLYDFVVPEAALADAPKPQGG